MTSAAPPAVRLESLLAPRSIAVIGASADAGKAGGRPIAYLARFGYHGPVYGVNPAYEQVAGFPCFPDVASLPPGVDLCVIAVPSPAVEGVLKECAAASIPAAVIFASGFAETGPEGAARQHRLARIARDGGIALCGPNCLGLVNFSTSATATFTTVLEREAVVPPGNVGFVTQSGAVGAFVLALAQDRQVGFSYFVTTGNEAVIGFTDVARFLLTDDTTSVISGYLEGVGGSELIALAEEALSHRKPLVVMKVGSSRAGARASVTHTGKLVGNDDAYEAAFRKYGIIRAGNIEELLDFSRTLGAVPPPRGANIGILSISGGAAILMADTCEQHGMTVPPLSADTVARLERVLPNFGTPNNPLDVTGRPLWDVGLLEGALAAMVDDPAIDMLIIHIGLASGASERIASEMSRVASATEKPMLVCWLHDGERGWQDRLDAAGIPVFSEPVRVVDAAAALVRYAKASASRDPEPDRHHATGSVPSLPGQRDETVVAEAGAKEFLRTCGLAVPQSRLTSNRQEAVAASDRLGYPVAIKLVSPDVTHRGKVGAVRTHVWDANGVATAFDDVLMAGRTAVANLRLEGVLIEQMVTGGYELCVAATRDDEFGPMIACGPGGVYVELLGRFHTELAPLGPAETERLLTAVGLTPDRAAQFDIDGVIEVLRLLSATIVASPEIDTIEINPLTVLPPGRGAVALDALVTRSGTSADTGKG